MNNTLLTLVFFSLVSCLSSTDQTDYLESHAQYQKSLRADRDHYLKLTGLHLLPEGKSILQENGTIESSELMNLDAIGEIVVSGYQVLFTAKKETAIKTVSEDSTITTWRYDMSTQHNSQMLKVGDLEWQVLNRDGKIFLRTKDQNSQLAEDFVGYLWFPVQNTWVLSGVFSPFSESIDSRSEKEKTLINQGYIGNLTVEIDGQEYELLVGEEGFLMIGDLTNDGQTYGGGRYLDLDLTDPISVTIDFNRLYNPPCVFSEFTTCPVPANQNRLPLKIEAGEMLN